jgi:hypothetical protein
VDSTHEIDPSGIESLALARLVSEIRSDNAAGLHATAYNRTYHRHNR